MKYITSLILTIFIIQSTAAQGPPITGDKAIMLGEGTIIVKNLTRIIHSDEGNYTHAPLMLHYLPKSNMLLALHIPYASTPEESGLGDITARMKYQIYRKDMRGKSHRIALKNVHWLPTGFESPIPVISSGKYQTLISVISGYETLKHGIGTEIGYRYIGGDFPDFWVFNLGFGLPLLKQVYPVNQLNLYFEYDSEWFSNGEKNIFYAQGLQYARKRITLDLAIQWPLVRNELAAVRRDYTVFLGARYSY